MVADICYRSPAMVTTLVRQEVSSPLWVAAHAGVLAIRTLASASNNADRPFGPWQWGPGAARSKPLRIRSIASAQASCAPRGGSYIYIYIDAETQIKERDGAKRGDAAGANQGRSAAGVSAPSRVVPKSVPVKRQGLLCSVIGLKTVKPWGSACCWREFDHWLRLIKQRLDSHAKSSASLKPRNGRLRRPRNRFDKNSFSTEGQERLMREQGAVELLQTVCALSGKLPQQTGQAPNPPDRAAPDAILQGSNHFLLLEISQGHGPSEDHSLSLGKGT